MTDSSNSSTATAGFDQVDEEILTYTLSDEALEAAAGTERGAFRSHGLPNSCASQAHPLACC